MTRSDHTVERRALHLSTWATLALGCIGVTFAWITGADVILLDGLFNLIYFATALFTLKVVRLLEEPEDEEFPYGYASFEPLVNILKGLLELGVSAVALFAAIAALAAGGRPIAAGPAVVYGAIATGTGWLVFLILRRMARRTQSPLLDLDVANWLVNAAISSAVLAAFAGVVAIRGTRLEFLSPYVDPVMVIAVVLVTIWIPTRFAWRALMELLNRAPSPAILGRVRDIVRGAIADLPVERLFVRVLQPGRTRFVVVHLVLPPDFSVCLPELDAIRARIWAALQAEHPTSVVDVLFTADARWADWSIQLAGAAQRP
jgi:predicted Co/Zn/Cd cation transporter (cation efflux family)